MTDDEFYRAFRAGFLASARGFNGEVKPGLGDLDDHLRPRFEEWDDDTGRNPVCHGKKGTGHDPTEMYRTDDAPGDAYRCPTCRAVVEQSKTVKVQCHQCGHDEMALVYFRVGLSENIKLICESCGEERVFVDDPDQ